MDSLHDQAREVGVELLVVDGHGEGLPADVLGKYPQVTRIALPGRSVFQMRAEGMARSRGAVVAVTEDHCRVAAEWCRGLIEAHERCDAAVIGGVVENGAVHGAVDWASFFIVNGASMPPVPNGVHRKVALQATVSYKQRVVPRDVPELGHMEWMLNENLRRQGEQLASDDRIRVDHVQSFTLREACSIHYHDSRSIAGFRLQRIGPMERLVRLAACAVMPSLLFLRTVLPVLGKRRRLGALALSAPVIALLVHFRAAGAFVGFIRGVGKSPLRIR